MAPQGAQGTYTDYTRGYISINIEQIYLPICHAKERICFKVINGVIQGASGRGTLFVDIKLKVLPLHTINFLY